MSKLKEQLKISYNDYLSKIILIPFTAGVFGIILFLIVFMPGRLSLQQCHEGVFYTLKLPYAMALYSILLALLAGIAVTIIPFIEAMWNTYATERMKKILAIPIPNKLYGIGNWISLILVILALGLHIYRQYFCIM